MQDVRPYLKAEKVNAQECIPSILAFVGGAKPGDRQRLSILDETGLQISVELKCRPCKGGTRDGAGRKKMARFCTKCAAKCPSAREAIAHCAGKKKEEGA